MPQRLERTGALGLRPLARVADQLDAAEAILLGTSAAFDFAPPALPENVPPVPERPAVAPVVVPRWVQMVLLPLAIIGAYALVRASGPVFLLFVVAGLIALLLNPVVALLQRAHVPRGLAVALVIVGVLAVPDSAAQGVADRLVANGIKIIFNYTGALLTVPGDVTVHTSSPIVELLYALYFYLT